MPPRPILLVLTLVLGCAAGEPAAPVATPVAAPVVPPVAPPPERAAEEEARAAMTSFTSALRAELVGTMQSDGPVAAAEVCAGKAQAMTRAAGETSGVTVGRSSLRLRNPANAAPAWVGTWLEAQGERPAAGVVGAVEVATGEDGVRVVRVLEPLAVQGPCLVCHGPEPGRDPGLAAVLAERYPEDRASGYAVGDLRGAVWAEAVVRSSAGATGR
jgi:hypothetical protein